MYIKVKKNVQKLGKILGMSEAFMFYNSEINKRIKNLKPNGSEQFSVESKYTKISKLEVKNLCKSCKNLLKQSASIERP